MVLNYMVVTSASYKWDAIVVYKICTVYIKGKISWVILSSMHGYGFFFS